MVNSAGRGWEALDLLEALLPDRTLCSYRTGCEVCVANKSCVLPCRFQAGQEVVIHWIYLDSTEGRTLSASGAKVKVQGSKRN